jgi:peptide-methionine (R)-S-oxide reductase
MKRFIGFALGMVLAAVLIGRLGATEEMKVPADKGGPSTQPASGIEKVVLTSAQWRERLTAEQYRILREHGTERAGSSPLNNEKRAGTYHCAGCELPLFVSDHKFDSGTGWPSFWQPTEPGHVLGKEDRSYGMVRTEVLCARCDGHLGHVFADGPKPTGLRYCINGEAMKFVPAE